MELLYVTVTLKLIIFVLMAHTGHCSPLDDLYLNNREDTTDIEVANQIEKIKEKILYSLGLDSVPNDTLSRDDIPSALMDEAMIDADMGYRNNTDSDDIEEKKTMIIGKLHSVHQCGSFQCVKVSFNHQLEPSDYNIGSAELWIHRKITDKTKPSKLSIHTPVPKKGSKKAIHVSHTTEANNEEGWFATQIKTSQILRHPRKNTNTAFSPSIKFKIKLKCDNCHFSNKKSHTPFVSLKTVSYKKRITRRSTEECKSRGCCRKSFIVTFKDIGWDNWVYFPERYNAYYCKGNCSGARHQYNHSGIVKAVSKKKDKLPVSFCCTPKTYSPLPIMYMQNRAVKTKTLQNMIVKECWCV